MPVRRGLPSGVLIWYQHGIVDTAGLVSFAAAGSMEP